MSWNTSKAAPGARKDSLKAAIQADKDMPQSVRDRLCEKVDAVQPNDTQIILVESDGHYDTLATHPTYGSVDNVKMKITLVPFYNTPLLP